MPGATKSLHRDLDRRKDANKCKAEKGARRSERPPQVQSEVLLVFCRLRSPKPETSSPQSSKTAQGRLSLGGNTDKKEAPLPLWGVQGFSGPLMEGPRAGMQTAPAETIALCEILIDAKKGAIVKNLASQSGTRSYVLPQALARNAAHELSSFSRSASFATSMGAVGFR
jgi:hypothetical protein